jgi:hypothetical protein
MALPNLVIIDLTKEYCAKCPRILYDGDGMGARVFVSSRVHTISQAVCGECLSPSEHPNIGSLQVRELFATSCQICEQRLDLLCTPCGRFSRNQLTLLHLIKPGHVFCSGCMAEYKSDVHRGCPTCRSSLPKMMDDLVPVRISNYKVINRRRPISIQILFRRKVKEVRAERAAVARERRSHVGTQDTSDMGSDYNQF